MDKILAVIGHGLDTAIKYLVQGNPAQSDAMHANI